MEINGISIQEETIKYFQEKADKYDLVEDQYYWRLSDKLLWNIFNERVLSKLPENFSFLDAGGGTGRWSLKILQHYPNAKGITYDLSKSMLEQARIKKEKYCLEERWKIIQGDLHNIESIPEGTIDVSFNFHNVLGFVEKPDKVLLQIRHVLRKGGYIVSFVPNKYHSIYFNLTIQKIEEAKKSAQGIGRFTENMPYIHLYSPTKLEKLYKEVGLEKTNLIGFPIFIYPGYKETQLEGSTDSLKDILSDRENFNDIYELETQFLQENLAARGNNLLIIGKK